MLGAVCATYWQLGPPSMGMGTGALFFRGGRSKAPNNVDFMSAVRQPVTRCFTLKPKALGGRDYRRVTGGT